MNFVIAPWKDYQNEDPVYVAKKGYKWVPGDDIKITSKKKLTFSGFKTYTITGNTKISGILNVFSVIGYVDSDTENRFYVRVVFPGDNNNLDKYIKIGAKVLTSFSKMKISDR